MTERWGFPDKLSHRNLLGKRWNGIPVTVFHGRNWSLVQYTPIRQNEVRNYVYICQVNLGGADLCHVITPTTRTLYPNMASYGC